MSRLIDGMRQFFTKRKPAPGDVERLRIEFRTRYHNFKLLLVANQKALEAMADIEQALESDRPFGMSFVRSRCTSLTVNVYSMIQNLEHLAPGSYAGLEDRFKEILAQIDRILKQEKPVSDERFIIPLDDVDKALTDSVGSKMANLGEVIRNTDIKVPPGFVLTAHAYRRFLDHNSLQTEIDRQMQTADLTDLETLYRLSSEIQQLIIGSPLPRMLAEALSEAWQSLADQQGQSITVALRSSAIGEDTTGSSFAGQYRSELNVSRDNVFQAYKEILASKYNLQAISYRMNKGFRDEDIAMCVGCMVMVNARSGGVIYSCNPVDRQDRAIYINATLGLPKSVVDGSSASDLFVVSRDKPLEMIRSEIQPKTHKFICYPNEGVCRMDLTGEAGTLPALGDREVIELARKALEIEKFYGQPQDIEWALAEDGTIYILQCRPLMPSESLGSKPVRMNVQQDDDTIILSGGVTASAGTASGKVYLVDKGFDVLGFPEGSVLVARQALPRWAPLLDRAAAVVTEQGGFAGHLANVAREFNVPALFGVKDAVAHLTNGKLVTVDASGLAVHAGKVQSLLAAKEQVPNLMLGSPVYETLKKAGRHIVPLNLLDPDSPDFKAHQCKTFHDITRFVHEKAVHEMFSFGRQHDFSERSSKQLHYHVPMQWWLLNLDDGFKQEIRGKYVHLEEIASIPMLAFWEGFVAIPWEGPPIDGKGLMSVFFRSTTNPALNQTVPSKFAERNYFLVSKYYCSLSSRLGYHFATLEALVSDRDTENYISYQFKGGAADDHRRRQRVHFIRDILMTNGFRVEIREDNLIARVEAQDSHFMIQRLKILGYLSLHTRQLDMIMANQARVGYYRKKIHRDIQTLLEN